MVDKSPMAEHEAYPTNANPLDKREEAAIPFDIHSQRPLTPERRRDEAKEKRFYFGDFVPEEEDLPKIQTHYETANGVTTRVDRRIIRNANENPGYSS